MIEAHRLPGDHGGGSSAEAGHAPAQDCRTIRELLAGQALHTLSPEAAAAVGSHLAACPACRDEHDCLAAVAAHLTRVRDALAHDAGRRQRTGASDRAECHFAAPHGPRRRGPVRAEPPTRLTLSDWVSRIT
jgi:anti-sigma factor ChrR (cupin superfamily)